MLLFNTLVRVTAELSSARSQAQAQFSKEPSPKD